MIEPICDVCGETLKDFGAILVSPPTIDVCIKQHICQECFEKKIIPLLKMSRTYSNQSYKKL